MKNLIILILKAVFVMLVVFFGKFIDILLASDGNVAYANIDNGFIFLLLAGLFYGSRKLYLQERE